MLDCSSLASADIAEIAAAFGAIGWNKPPSLFERYLAEQSAGQRVAIVARLDGAFAGYVTLLWRSDYAPFAEAEIPEIADLNVLPHYRRRSVASRLMDRAETAAKALIVGIAVGLDGDYGNAQRLYAKRGYVPDGRGVSSGNQLLKHGDVAKVDDSLVLHLIKTLR